MAKIPIHEAITVAQFFKTLDEIVRQNDTLSDYPLSENLLLRANPWILDTLVNTDYHIQMSRGNFVYEQQKMVILKPASNGCIGTSEADAWRMYFFAPLGTKVQIRYDLVEVATNGDTIF